MAESKTPAIEQAIRERFPYCSVLPHGSLTEIGDEFGVSRERVRQIAVSMGLAGTRRPTRERVFCGRCGVEMPRSRKNRRACAACTTEMQRVPLVCDGCGVSFTRAVNSLLDNQGGRGAAHRGKYSGKVYCSRICPGRPAGFSITLTTDEWKRAPEDSTKYRNAVTLYWHTRGYGIRTERREDGRYYRLVKKGD